MNKFWPGTAGIQPQHGKLHLQKEPADWPTLGFKEFVSHIEQPFAINGAYQRSQSA